MPGEMVTDRTERYRQPVDATEPGAGRFTTPARGIFSCVVDADPRFHLDALRWYATLSRIVGVEPVDMVVHVVGGSGSDVLAYLESVGVTIVPVAAFDSRSPHCNKISGALALADRGVDGVAVLSDTDIVFLEDPRRLPLEPHSVGLRIVGGPNPPLSVLLNVFRAAGVQPPPRVAIERDPGEWTLGGHGNGGLYLVPAMTLSPLAQSWSRWARWLLARGSLLQRWSTFVDQTAMTLALAEDERNGQSVGVHWNFPSQRPERIPDDVVAPCAIHYHKHLTSGGLLASTGHPVVDERIATANAAIAEVWHEALPNASFWDWRYRSDPERGSGMGSRGEPLAEKRELIGAVVAMLSPDSVLDVGCGDGQATIGLPLGRYVGIDVSAQAVRLAREGRPDGDYRIGLLCDQDVTAELTLCLDVLIHQAERSVYRDLVRDLLGSSTIALLVSGYEQRPSANSPIVHFHEPLSETLKRIEPDAALHRVREVHEVVTYLAVKPRGPGRPSSGELDIGLLVRASEGSGGGKGRVRDRVLPGRFGRSRVWKER